MNLKKRTTSLMFMMFVALMGTMAQNCEKLYDYNWKECKLDEARFYSLTSRTDSGYVRKNYYVKEKRVQMIGKYQDSLCEVKNGKFTFYHTNGIIESSGKYIQNKKDGLWLRYYYNSIMRDSAVYLQDNQMGKSLSWYPNGYLCDSISLNADRSGVHFSWFDNGTPSVVGRYSTDMKQNGNWTYFHKNGKISSIEMYNQAKLISKQHFDENGELQNDTLSTDKKAQFAGGMDAWKKYISKSLYFPRGYKIVNGDQARIVVCFTVNEAGEVENVFTSTSFDKQFDEIAENAIRKSPKWLPATSHNRNIKEIFYQYVTFLNNKERE
jgi:antitoxin component YwqK of YwqJK toxin-antitoxin module